MSQFVKIKIKNSQDNQWEHLQGKIFAAMLVA